MEENAVLNEVEGVESSDVITELRYISAEIRKTNENVQALRLDVTLLVMFVAILVVYKIRDVFLSFVKKGGIKRDV